MTNLTSDLSHNKISGSASASYAQKRWLLTIALNNVVDQVEDHTQSDHTFMCFLRIQFTVINCLIF